MIGIVEKWSISRIEITKENLSKVQQHVLEDGTVVIEEATDFDQDLQEDNDFQESNGEKKPE